MRTVGNLRTCKICNETYPNTSEYFHKKHRSTLETRCKSCKNIDTNRKHRADREAAIQHYGGKCACCGEQRYEFLAIDHIDGGGLSHRKTEKFTRIHTWLRRNNYPEGFRVLCHNCNSAIGFYGHCPHALEETTDIRSRLYQLAGHNRVIMMGDDPRLPKMPKHPTLIDFFQNRFTGTQHLLQSANLARLAGHDEKIVTACLLHDIAVCGFIRGDHGYFGAQMVSPYVDEEIAWAIRTHQALRFFPDESVGYTYPDAYLKHFGEDYQPDEYIRAEYEAAKHHRWYMTARLITIYDVYAFDPNVTVDLDDYVDILGRNFRQPKEGLGFDNSPCAHLWRTIIRPNKFL